MSSDPTTPESPRLCACGCGREVKTPGRLYTSGHHQRRFWADAERKFYARIQVQEGPLCYPWTGKVDRDGYGHVGYKGRRVQAHRLVWELAKGPLKKGECVCHRCDNPRCCRLDHLFVDSVAGNNHDRALKGRSAKTYGIYGTAKPLAKLNDDKVREMRRKRANGTLLIELSREYDIGLTTVRQVVHRQTWRHVE